ncbi:MAG TPA: putative oxidoreductase C-terminal domain-containing protein [Stellaceae bacterium]|jgi:predicted dehydrogenase|nr:putative oxidoreductase C-terminal domain-containing protein [Stellaceae bacterium]
MPDTSLIVVDPGHFHAALVQREMYATLSPRARVYAPLGPELLDYLGHIARFNGRPQAPTCWQLDIDASPDFLARMRDEPPGGVAIFSGRNDGKIARIAAALEAGLHVLADKPIIIRRDDLPMLETALETAAARRLIFSDIMTGRCEVVSRVIRLLRADPEIFGEPLAGTRDEPGVALSGVHHLLKTVAGVVNQRPPWYFDVSVQGEGLADTAVHHVDRARETLFPGEAIDYRRDIEMLAASRWPTPLSLAQFQRVTGEAGWPGYLGPWLDNGVLNYFCNGQVDYRVRGIHVRIEVRWDWEAPHGDTHSALYRGSRCRLEVRQGADQRFRPELYVVPQAEIGMALERRVAAAQADFPGLELDRLDGEWRVVIPDALRVGHEANFAEFARAFLAFVENPATWPAREKANLLAKYFVCTEAVALSQD